MLNKPTQAYRRFQYETGQSTSSDGVIPAATAFEQSSFVSQSACLLSSIEAVAIETAGTAVYLLGFDVAANDANLQLAIGGALGAARFTWGPMDPGATLVRDASETFSSNQVPFFRGIPLDRGLLVVASATPRIWTAPGAGQTYALLVRGTTSEGC